MSIINITAMSRQFPLFALYVALIGGLFISSARACLNDCSIDVNFIGTYIDESCDIVINNTSSDETVKLPRISTSSLLKNGSEAGSVPFDITLKDCPASRTVKLYFNSSVSNADTGTGNLINNTGTTLSRNVQIRLRKENGSQVIIDDATTGQDYIISPASEALNHQFTASYYAKGDSAVTAGLVRAAAGVVLVYR